MNRRKILSVLPLIVGLSGCSNQETPINGEGSSVDGEENPTGEEGSTDYDWRLSADVHQDFSGNVTLQTDCRDRNNTVTPKERVTIEGNESCRFHLLINGTEVHNTTKSGAGITYLEVTEDGEVKQMEAAH